MEDTDSTTGAFESEAAPSPEVAASFIGKLYGKWKLLEHIGQGGVGFVFRATHTDEGRTAAVKILRDTFSQDPEGRARFKREGDLTTNRLQHPNVLRGHLFGEQAGIQYFVSEFIEGETLEALILREKKLSPEKTVSIMDPLLLAIQHTHEQNVVHRDVKPANVMLGRSGRVVLIDYGLAKDERAKLALTRMDQVMGSLSYMSPEQARGQRGVYVSDLYSCGVLMFVMLTGNRPFNGDTPQQLVQKHIHDRPPSVRLINPSVPPSIEAVVAKLLEKDPQNRFASAAEVREALERAIPKPPASPPTRRTESVPTHSATTLPTTTPPAPAQSPASRSVTLPKSPPRISRVIWGGVAVVVAALILLMWFLLRHH